MAKTASEVHTKALRQLTKTAIDEKLPYFPWSPDGNKLLWWTKKGEIFVFELESAQARRIAQGEYPSWAPNGKGIAFGGADIWLATLDGTKSRLTYDPETKEVWIAISPDGKRISFAKQVPGRYTFTSGGKKMLDLDNWVIGIDGSNPYLLFGNPLLQKQTIWNPKGDKLLVVDVVVLNREKNCYWYVVSLHGSKQIEIKARHIFWDPRGEKLTFDFVDDAGNSDIYIINADGTELRRLTHDPAWDRFPRFSPNGLMIAWHKRIIDKKRGLFTNEYWVMNADGSNKKKLYSHSVDREYFYDDWLSWSPNGKYLAWVSTRAGNRDIWLLELKMPHPKSSTK